MPRETFKRLPETKRAAIERAAIEEFANSPYRNASINTIVDKAGIAKGSLYQYFKDKRDLYGYILSIVQQKKKVLAASLTPPSNSMDTFAYLRWMAQLDLLFRLREPELANIEQYAFLEAPLREGEDPETGERVMGDTRFQDFLTQGILHDDIATWVDTGLAAYILGVIINLVGPYLIARLGKDAESLKDGSVDILYEPHTQALLDNLLDVIEAGIARDPQIRKDYYSK